MSLIAVLHGPNLNLLGSREPAIYGRETLDDIDAALQTLAAELGHEVLSFQSNHEGVLIDRIHGLRGQASALVLNLGAYTHTSVALRDALAAVRDELILVEAHLSIPAARESFRQINLMAPLVHGRVEGFGALSYLLALRAASALIARRGFDL